MKKLLLLALTALMVTLPLQAQQIRTNYRSGGITHISTEYEDLMLDQVRAQLRVELAGFPDGSSLYLLYLILLQKDALNVPKGVKMAVNLPGGKLVRLEQIGQDSATKRRLDDGLFVNRLKYAAEPADMEKMVKGIASVDIVTGWNPDDYVQGSFSKGEMAALLKRHCTAIREAAAHTIDLTATLAGYSESAGSNLSSANPIMGSGAKFDYNIILTHLYYKNSNKEDLDLAFVIGSEQKYHVPYDAPVRFTLKDGSVIELLQARDDVNFVYVYPTLEDFQRMASVGIAALAVAYEGGTLTDTFPAPGGGSDFSSAVNQQLQLLLSLSPR